ncbi:MAG: CBS domain-containing protein [Acidilobaceae archaeon]
MTVRVSKYMSTPVYTVKPEDTIAYARNLMLSKDISRLVVVDSSMRPVGVITITDIVNVIAARSENTLDEILVRDTMSRNIIVIEENKSIKTVSYLMLKYKIGGLPVVDKSKILVGIITRTDLVRAFVERYKGLFKVEDISRKDVTVAKRTHSISYVIKLVNIDPAGKVVVVDEDMKPLGVISKRDIAFIEPIELSNRGKESFRKYKADAPAKARETVTRMYLVPVAEDIMTPNPIVARIGEDAAEASKRLIDYKIGCLPLVDEANILRGIITKLEILAAIALKTK